MAYKDIYRIGGELDMYVCVYREKIKDKKNNHCSLVTDYGVDIDVCEKDIGITYILGNLFKSLSSNIKNECKEWFKQMAEAIVARRSGSKYNVVLEWTEKIITSNQTITIPTHDGLVDVLLFGAGGGGYGGRWTGSGGGGGSVYEG